MGSFLSHNKVGGMGDGEENIVRGHHNGSIAKDQKLALSSVLHCFYAHFYKCAAADHTAGKTETLK